MDPSEIWTAQETNDPAMLDRVYRLRVDAWRARNPDFPPMEVWTDAFDAVGRHWVILDEGELVAAARLTTHRTLAEAPGAEIYRGIVPDALPGPVGVLTRLVVARSHARRGLVHGLDLARIEAATEMGCRNLFGATLVGLSRIDDMRALGFEVVGIAHPYEEGPLRGLPDPRPGGCGAGVQLVCRLRLGADQASPES